MTHFYVIILLLFSLNTFATTRIAVIDTGFDLKKKNLVNLCDSDHKSFINDTIQDDHGHGTNVAGLIAENNTDYCLVIIRYYSSKLNRFQNMENYFKALSYVNTIKLDIVNLSLGGTGFQKNEKKRIVQLLDNGIQVVASAGNEFMDLNKSCNYFPACYDSRINVVGNSDRYSNRGKIVDVILNGGIKYSLGLGLKGTSQSAAIFTNNLVRKINESRKSRKTD